MNKTLQQMSSITEHFNNYCRKEKRQEVTLSVLGAVQYLQFPLALADHGFALTPFSLSFLDYILFCVL